MRPLLLSVWAAVRGVWLDLSEGILHVIFPQWFLSIAIRKYVRVFSSVFVLETFFGCTREFPSPLFAGCPQSTIFFSSFFPMTQIRDGLFSPPNVLLERFRPAKSVEPDPSLFKFLPPFSPYKIFGFKDFVA